MKRYVFALAAAALLAGCTQTQPEAESVDSASAVIDCILTRTSVRQYTDQAVEPEQIETMLRCAMAAPTAVNKQPWQFYVVTDRAVLDSIAGTFGSMRMAAQAPLAVIVCGNMTQALDGEAQEYWVQDASAATENLLLAAHAMGLGAVWCGIYPLADRVATLKGMIEMPDEVTPLNVICIGHPAESPTPKDKWKPEKITNITAQ